ncbi:MAG: hypothetical protein ACYTEQ_27710 [Planctomycetota bacterium]|jgi:hypothetical protein
MNAFVEASKIEAESWRRLMPWIEHSSKNGRCVRIAKGRLSKELQARYGDVFAESEKHGGIIAIEGKAERDYTGNLFLETWSNRKWWRLGWMFTLDCDVLLYHFLTSDKGQRLYHVAMNDLRKWAFVQMRDRGDRLGRVWDYRAAKQKRYAQLNDTWGRVVPIQDLKREAGLTDLSDLFCDFIGEPRPSIKGTLFE